MEIKGLQPIWDKTIIDEQQTTAAFLVGTPVKREAVFAADRPWEGEINYANVLKDGDIYKMYYITHIRSNDKCAKYTYSEDEILANKWLLFYTNIFVCYAESKDGVHWKKPDLGLCEYKGNKNNNIILRSEDLPGRFSMWDNFFVFKDTNPDCPKDEVYKGIGFDCKLLDDGVESEFREGLSYYASPDGKVFRFIRVLEIKNGTFDTLNTCSYDEVEKRYVLYYRGWHNIPADGDRIKGTRDIKVAWSSDFVKWNGFEQIKFNDSEDYPLYTNNIMRYYRNKDIRIGFPTRYTERPCWTSNYDELTGKEARIKRMSNGHPREGLAITDCIFMCSRNGEKWDRINEAFLTPGQEVNDNWVYGDCYPAYSMIETMAEDGENKEISFYMPKTGNNENSGEKTPEKLYRWSLRRDGFAYYCANAKGGTVITKPFVFKGKGLRINFATSAYGNIKIVIKDKEGNEASTCELFGDSDNRNVKFENADITDFSGKEITLTFEMKDAKLYAFEFLG